MPPTKGHRQQRGLARQQQIREAAFELFAANGYRSTTIAMVAERVGISDTGVLHHFPSKEALLLAVLEARDHPDVDAELFTATPGGGLGSLRRLPILAQVLLDQPLLMRFDSVVGGESISEGGAAFEHFRDRLALARKGLEAMIAIGIQRGEIRADVDAHTIAQHLVAFMSGIQTQWLFDPESIDLRAAYKSFITMLEAFLTRT